MPSMSRRRERFTANLRGQSKMADQKKWRGQDIEHVRMFMRAAALWLAKRVQS